MRLFVCEMKLVTLWLLMVVTRDSCTCAKQDDGRILTSPQFKNSSSLTWLKQNRSKGFSSSVGGTAAAADRPIKIADEWSQDGDEDGACSWDGGTCTWQGDGFQVTTGKQLAALMRKDPRAVSGPLADMRGDSDGHFLYVGGSSSGAEAHHQIYSPQMKPPTSGTCKLQFNIHANNIKDGAVGLFYEALPSKHVADIATAHNAATDNWKTMTLKVGAIKTSFRLMLEIWTKDASLFHAAFNDIKFVDCFPPKPTSFNVSCSDDQSFECQPGQCISKTAVCDINVDCSNGLDEGEICEEVIKWNAYCNFESDSCGWRNVSDNDIWWRLNKADKYLIDNTFKNDSGHFMQLNLSRNNKMGHRGGLRSAVFPPPPKDHSNPNSFNYLSCQVRFNYRMFGNNVAELLLYVVELIPGKPPENVTLWSFEYRKKNRKWLRATMALPPITHRYYLQFDSRLGISHLYNITIDDFSLSPQCFTPGHKFTTCGAVGFRGPTQSQCDLSYKSSGLKVRVNDDGALSGIQNWTVPESGVYSVTAKGSGGGQGLRNRRPSRGDVVYGVFNWTQGEEIYILVGQRGGDACSPEARLSPQIVRLCEAFKSRERRRRREVVSILTMKLLPTNNLTTGGGGGGGGGATYIFKKNESSGTFIPLLISSGGGGLGAIITEGAISPDGRGYDQSLTGTNGRSSSNGTGAGGGWNDTNKQSIHCGWSLAVGGFGGKPCKESDGWLTSGGFGGGGGGCSAGGGGGGYNGGDASMNDSMGDNGAGGYSYNASAQVRTILPVTVTSSRSTADGSVNIFPAFIGCECEYLCVIFDVEGVLHSCICPSGQTLSDDELKCHALGAPPNIPESSMITQHLMTILPVALIVVLAISTAMFLLYHRYRRQMALQVQRQECPYVRDSSELQLNRLRQNAAGRVTEYNPNYEFGGSMCTIQDLKDVNRENLTLVKALGQGAFGEVYQGYLSNVPGEITDIPVAIKTLPELSSDQAEMDFLMEALIMSKFSNPNIVKFIGVCFEKLPKFIVLELLTGGDLKSFLRESRRKPEKPSSLSMRDLLMMAMDVAKGCQYLEDNHFIHRDIAARNCLLTSRDVTRVVKIADFGMARDIYRADYYRKGGKAMLPVKWMPPEAFMDGIFTSKTDVWSFGVLLWEVMSLGFMPYPGRGNQEVMQLVTSGGRLEPPPNCPGPVHQIMIQCWNSVPDERPNFSTILERLGYCLQDPHVTSAPLPVFHRPPSTERDTTIMRPPDSDVCLQVHRSDIKEPQSPSSNDYLVPIPSNYSLCTEKTELQSASSLESVDRILEMEPDQGGKAGAGRLTEEGATCRDPLVMPSPLKPNFAGANNWETSFSKDKSHLGALGWGGSGGYQSVPTQDMDSIGSIGGGGAVARVPLATIPPPECSPARKSPPSAIARQRPNYAKKSSSATPELALDASSLQKQTSPPPNYPAQVVSYANVAVSNSEPVRTTSYIYGGSSKDVKC